MKAEDILKDIKEDLCTTLLATRTGMKNIENDLSEYNSEQTAPERAYIDSVKEAMDSSEEQNKFQEEEKIYAVKNKDNYLLCFFKNKEKAEYYCERHKGCCIEEYEFEDEKMYTPYDFVVIRFDMEKGKKDLIDFDFKKNFLEENLYYTENRETLTLISKDHFRITINRLLPYGYNEEKIRNKYIEKFNKMRHEGIIQEYLDIVDAMLSSENDIKENISLFHNKKRQMEANIRGILGIEAILIGNEKIML